MGENAAGGSIAKRLRTAAPTDRAAPKAPPLAKPPPRAAPKVSAAPPRDPPRRASLVAAALADTGKTPVTAGAGAIGKKHIAKVPNSMAKALKAKTAAPAKSAGITSSKGVKSAGITSFFGKAAM